MDTRREIPGEGGLPAMRGDRRHGSHPYEVHGRQASTGVANGEGTMGEKTPKLLRCRMANSSHDSKPDEGKDRLYRILTSETAYPIRKLQNRGE